MKDIKHTTDGDIDLSTGDLQWVEPTDQHQRDLLIMGPGESKEYPLDGVDSIKYLNDTDATLYLRTVKQQFTRDGMNVRSISMDVNGKMITDAEYETN